MKLGLISTGLAALALLAGCQSHDPIPATQCGEVVSHARQLLGDQADPWAKMTRQCQAASDQERGCVLVADSAADILRCAM